MAQGTISGCVRHRQLIPAKERLRHTHTDVCVMNGCSTVRVHRKMNMLFFVALASQQQLLWTRVTYSFRKSGSLESSELLRISVCGPNTAVVACLERPVLDNQ